MIYFIGGLSNREFKYFDIIESIRKNNQGIQESFFDVEIKEENKFLDKISFNSIFSLKELIVLKRAEKLKNILHQKNYRFYLESPTNQQFIIIKNTKMEELAKNVSFSFWEKYDEKHTVIRLATS